MRIPWEKTEIKEIKIRGLSEAERDSHRRTIETIRKFGLLPEDDPFIREALSPEPERHVVDSFVQAREPGPENRYVQGGSDYRYELHERLVPLEIWGSTTSTMGGFGSYSTTGINLGRAGVEPAPAHIIIGGTEEEAAETFDLDRLKDLYDFLFLIRAAMGQGTKNVRRHELIDQINRNKLMRGHGFVMMDAPPREIKWLRDLAEEKIFEYLKQHHAMRDSRSPIPSMAKSKTEG